MSDVTKAALLSALRSILTVLGSSLVAHGYINDAGANELIGAGMVIAPLVWGIVEKYRAETKTQVRETTAVNAGIAAATPVDMRTPPPVVLTKSEAQNVIKTGTP